MGKSDATRHVYLDSRMEQPEIVPVTGGQVAVFVRPVPEATGPNEDAAAIVNTDHAGVVLVVADGAGGQPAGDKAAAIAVQTVIDSVQAATDEDEVRTAIVDGFDRANAAILELGVGAATTLAVVQVSSRGARTFHAGDSGILITGQRGLVKHATLHHSPVAYAVEAGVLDAEEALHHEDLNLVTNFVGATDMRITVGPTTPLALRDTILLGSDGLFDNLHDYELVECVRKGPLADVAAALLALCDERMTAPKEGMPSKPDDLAFLVYRPIGD